MSKIRRRISKRILIGIAAIAIVAIAAGLASWRVHSPPADLTWLHDAALKASQSMGEPNPTMQYALTTEGVAKTAMRLGRSPAQDPTAPVYVVVLKGTFTRNWGSPKAPTVAGTTLALEFASQRDASVNGPLALSGTVDTSRLGALSSFTQ